jgi:Flp pilus assembly protein TadG
VRKNGQSLVEMALLLPVLLLLSVAAIDFGRGIYYYSAIYNAAREGARYGIIDPTDTTGIETAVKKLTVGLDQDSLSITIIPNPPDPDINTIQVKVDYSFELVTPIAKLFTTCGCGIIDLHTSSAMIIER